MPDHFPEVLRKTLTMFDTEPELTTTDIAQITAPTLVMSGDDEVVHLAHTLSLYEALPNGQLAVVPGASHLLPMEKPEETARLVLDFLAADRPACDVHAGAPARLRLTASAHREPRVAARRSCIADFDCQSPLRGEALPAST